MTRKRLRYSELAGPAAPPSEELPAPAAEPTPAPPDVIEVAPSDSGLLDVGTDSPVYAEALTVERDDDAPLISAIDDHPAAIELSVASVEGVVPRAKHHAPVAKAAVAPAAVSPTRPRRNSTPVELARTLTAERLAARALDGDAGDDSGDWNGSAGVEPVVEERTLRERARSRSGTAELLMFRVGGERFAVELIQVDEVIDLPVIHHVPEMPPAMLGVVTVRGSLTPVYSPQHALGLPLALRDALLIFRRGPHRVGILIDDVDDALAVDMEELRERPAGEEGDNVLLGVIRLANTLVGIIDIDALIISCQSANILEPA